MKNSLYKKFGLISFISVLVLSLYNCEPEPDRPPIKQLDPSKILTINDIYKIYSDSGDNYTFADDYMLYAYVIMDDSSGNIYKEAYIQDSTGGINLYKLSTKGAVEVGDYVRINLKKVRIKNYSGKMELIFDSIYDITKNIIVVNKRMYITPAEVTIEDIYTAKYDCELVKIKDVQFSSNQFGMCYANRGGTSSQNRKLENCNGKTMIVRTSDYANFADDTLPTGKGDIIGVITKYIYSGGDTAWQLIVRDPKEFNLTNPRCR